LKYNWALNLFDGHFIAMKISFASINKILNTANRKAIGFGLETPGQFTIRLKNLMAEKKATNIDLTKMQLFKFIKLLIEEKNIPDYSELVGLFPVSFFPICQQLYVYNYQEAFTENNISKLIDLFDSGENLTDFYGVLRVLIDAKKLNALLPKFLNKEVSITKWQSTYKKTNNIQASLQASIENVEMPAEEAISHTPVNSSVNQPKCLQAVQEAYNRAKSARQRMAAGGWTFFSRGMKEKGDEIQKTMDVVSSRLATFNKVDELLDYKNPNEPGVKTLREALNINRLLVKRDITTSLASVLTSG